MSRKTTAAGADRRIEPRHPANAEVKMQLLGQPGLVEWQPEVITH